MRLTNLINDFLDLQRMESGKQLYEIQSFDAGELLSEVVELQKVAAPAHVISFNKPLYPLRVHADRDKLKQALMNLMGNAVKYSPGGEEIRSHFVFEKRRSDNSNR